MLLLVVDGMSGAVAGDLTDAITDRRTGWTEMSAERPTGAREAVLAARPTETTFSRTSLFAPASGGRRPSSGPRSAAPLLAVRWRGRSSTRPVSRDATGRDLGAELE